VPACRKPTSRHPRDQLQAQPGQRFFALFAGIPGAGLVCGVWKSQIVPSRHLPPVAKQYALGRLRQVALHQCFLVILEYLGADRNLKRDVVALGACALLPMPMAAALGLVMLPW